ncbi:MAG: GH92 family glycosyl hydrolase, partial [Bacteroidia bacterium]
KRLYLFALSLIFLSGYGQVNLTQYVNPFIGTGGHGHTFPGAVLPFGMVQLSPDTRIDGSWDGCSGYHYSDSIIYGFSHTHLSGTGVSDWGDILIMPTVGSPSLDNKIYSSRFDHKNEKAAAGFYEVLLNDDNIKAELTTTLRTGIHRYSFSKTSEANIILDLVHRDKRLDSRVQIIDSVTISGYRISEAWAKYQQVYFVIRFSKPFKKMEFIFQKSFRESINFIKSGKNAQGAYFQFDLTDEKPLMVKVAISSVSAEGALKNLEAEAKHWDFEKYKKEAEQTWNTQLKKIEITEEDKNKLSVFYTALYHTCIHPSLNMDVDNQYRGVDQQVHTAKGFTNYSVFSLWDTYRALHPLFTIIERKHTVDFINTFLAQYSQSGRLPVWELSGNETDCMIGFHSVSVIADAMAKGINGFDTALVYRAVQASATYSNFGIPAFNKKGYLQIDDESESVSRSLEYGYDNWCIAQIVYKIGRKEVKNYLKLAQSYRNLYNDSIGLIRPRKNGNWLSPFYGGEINNHFTEGNSWQYSFYAPHDIEGLIRLHGSKQKFENKLDELFMTKEKLSGRDQSDVTGLIGQYAHGNEPSHHMAYLYNFVDKPQKTIQLTQQICNNFYKNSPDGLIGNEDCGQMSAWYIFSSMGMYPVCPGSTQYILSSPLFKTIKINLENGKTFTITNGKQKEKIIGGYIINNKQINTSSLEHELIMTGGKMDYLYVSENDPSNEYGKNSNSPLSAISVKMIIPAPIILSASQVFQDKVEITILPLNLNAGKIFYTIDGTEPTASSKIYSKPFFIETNCTIKAITFSDNENSAITEARFFKLKNNYDVQLVSKPNPQYSSDGGQSLIDGIYDELNWRKGNWLGFQYQDFECIVDMKKKKDIDHFSIECLQDSRSWILYPTVVYYYGSDDNKNYKLIDSVSKDVAANDYKLQIQRFEKRLSKKVSYRYIKIIAKNFGKLPEWHEGKGDGAFIFVDELEIE